MVLSKICFALAFVLNATESQEITLENKFLRVITSPSGGDILEEFRILATDHDLAGKGGLLQEGFGIGSFYVPNRRLNQRTEPLHDVTGHAAFRYSYDCDGPNIKNLHVTRTVEFYEDRTGVRVTWQVENRGTEDQWIAPWVRCDVAAGGTFDAKDRIDVPTPDGILQPRRSAYYPAARNWIAVTDPAAQETVYGVFNAEELHSFLALYDSEENVCGFQAAFVPRVLAKGASWRTIYHINAVRGLESVHFATDEFAAQVEYAPGLLRLCIAPAQPLADAVIRTRLREGSDVFSLPDKQFDLVPMSMVRCTYDWRAPIDAIYELLAQVSRQQKPVTLGKDTASPHGGIDTAFSTTDGATAPLEPWTDAPHRLDHGGRQRKRTPLLTSSNLHLWADSSLTKVFREDVLDPVGNPSSTITMSLARNERESCQIVIRAAGDEPLTNVNVAVSSLKNQRGDTIPASSVEISRVAYYPVRIPTHFETPTGNWPDPLVPCEPFSIPAGESAPIWFTVFAPPELPSGIYKGVIEITTTESSPIEVFLEVRVWDFALPQTPHLKTDFGFWAEAAHLSSKKLGYSGSLVELISAYKQNAFAHRVTLREITQFPPESPDYAASLRTFKHSLTTLNTLGATTFAVPPSLIDVPEQLRQADEFTQANALTSRAFCPIADQPPRPAWPRLLERMQQWKTLAPHIPIMVTTYGLEPFIPDTLDIWTVHLPVMDTANNRRILERVQQGGEVWIYVNHEPARPYANFFIDFESVEHRILFWQAWALGVKGVHYAGINAIDLDQSPYTNQLDITPTNGNNFLVYPGPSGPVNSIRWENIRDGIEDYDYLIMFHSLLRNLEKSAPNDPLVKRARTVANLNNLIPNLVEFSRDPELLLAKRNEIGELIEQMSLRSTKTTTPSR